MISDKADFMSKTARKSEVTRARAFFVRGGKCGARTQTGRPCRAKGLGCTYRCRWHGGMSTGPKTPEGRTKALANLKQFKRAPAGRFVPNRLALPPELVES